MPKLQLPTVTLFGADTVDLDRLLNVFAICEQYADFGAKKILAKSDRDYTTESGIDIRHTDLIDSLDDYNAFMLRYLNDHIDTDFALVVQYDGFILNPDAWTDEFLAYDYIGAPWYIDGTQVVGNGGFSIRSKRLLETVQRDPHIAIDRSTSEQHCKNDDWLLCVLHRERLEQSGIRFASPELAHRFSLEENEEYGGVWSNQFGFHGLRWTDISAWIKENPQWGIENPLDQTSL